MPVTKVKVNGEWVPAMPVGGGGEGDMTKAVYDTNDDGVVNAADQATKDGSGNVITTTYAAKATTLSGYGITDAKIENGVITLGSNTITPLTSVPVASVNGQTGTVVLDADDVGALPDNTPIPEFFEIEIAYIDSEEDYSLKTSASDIVAAYNAGKTIVGKYTGYESTSSVSPYFTSAIATIYANYDPQENEYYFRFWDMFNIYEVVCWDDDGTLTASLDHYPGQFVTYQTMQDNIPNMQVYPTAYCETGGSYKTKIAKCTNWAAAANTYIHVLMKYENITSNALTLNINNTGSKPIYINGTVSSSNNKALPAGSYLVFYNGVNFYFRTDGVLPQPTGYGDSVNPYTSKLANYILAGPTSGSASAPSFRALVAADIPTLTASKLSDVSISNGTITIGSNTITPLTSFTESDPIFTASAAYGISSSDITNWNNKVSDTKTWGDVVAPDSRSDTSDNRYIPQFSATSSSSGTTATFTLTRVEPFSLGVPKWDYSNYLYAATPTSTDNSTKVATTAFVQTALGGYIASDTTANFTISDTAPSNPQTGDLWLDTNSQSATGIAYLPLTAGDSNQLTGDLFFNFGGNKVGRIHSMGTGISVNATNEQDNFIAGFLANDANTIVYSNGNNIYLRPNGWNSTGVEAYMGTSGRLIFSSDNSHYGGIDRTANGTTVSYLRQTYSGYLDIWSTQATQIRVGAGNQESNTVRFLFGSNGVLTAPGMYTTTRSGSTLVIDSSGAIGRTSSLRKYKKNIEDVTEEQADKGYELRPITYESAIEDDIKERQFGFIAEEVEEVVPELCTYDLEGNVDGVAYERVCSLLLKQNQMLKAQVDALEKRVEELERR